MVCLNSTSKRSHWIVDMLKNDDRILDVSDLDLLLSDITGNNPKPMNVVEGVYLIGSFHIDNDNYIMYPDLDRSPYGVCDTFLDVIDEYPELSDPERVFILALTPIIKERQPARYGWRWIKWGPYIGNQKITTEYLYDEPFIEMVYVYHIYERKS